MVRFQEACASIREDASTLPRRVLDVGFLGATLPNLTAALALCSHYEGARIQVGQGKGTGKESGRKVLGVLGKVRKKVCGWAGGQHA